MSSSGSMARRASNIHRNITVTPFLNKLYSMVDDSASDDLIRWSDSGNSFFVKRREEFANDVLPRFFKHNNLSSFVRQLNMYGFHKVPHLQQGGLIADDPNAEDWEFSNNNFQRGQPDLMHFIRRKKGTASTSKPEDSVGDDGEASENESDENGLPATRRLESRSSKGAAGGAGSSKPRSSKAQASDLGLILKEIQVIRDHQMTISADIKRLQGDNRSLWKQASAAEERYKRHQATIDKILRFLATVFSPDNQHAEIHPPLRRLISHTSQSQSQGPSGHASSTRSGTSTPEKRAMPTTPPTVDTAQDGDDYNDNMYEDTDAFLAQRPPDKRMRTKQTPPSSRITEVPLASPLASGTKRKASSPMSTALTRTNLARPLSDLASAGAGLGADINALMASPGSPYGALRTQSKSIEQLQSEIDYLGISLDNLTRLLQYGAHPNIPMTPSNMSAAAAAVSGLQTSLAPPTDSMAQYQPQALVPGSGISQGFDMSSILSSEALNSMALSLSGVDALPSLSSAPLPAGDAGILNGTSLASLGMAGNQPTAAPQDVMDKGMADNMDAAVLMGMLKSLTPEQYNSLQSRFRQISGNSVPLLTAGSETAVTPLPEAPLNETPFLDFVGANAADAAILGSSATEEAVFPAGSTGSDDYTQILLDAFNARAGAEASAPGEMDPLFAASILDNVPSMQTTMSAGQTASSADTPSPGEQG
ncbi:Heat shock transcription factor [Coemansia sp. RSA 2559]|nr:Heat shock transcription factor [Coemansia sp. RSA 2559]